MGLDFGADILPGTHIAIAGLDSGAGVGGMLATLGVVSPTDRKQLEAAPLVYP